MRSIARDTVPPGPQWRPQDRRQQRGSGVGSALFGEDRAVTADIGISLSASAIVGRERSLRSYTFCALRKTLGTMWVRCVVCRRCELWPIRHQPQRTVAASTRLVVHARALGVLVHGVWRLLRLDIPGGGHRGWGSDVVEQEHRLICGLRRSAGSTSRRRSSVGSVMDVTSALLLRSSSLHVAPDQASSCSEGEVIARSARQTPDCPHSSARGRSTIHVPSHCCVYCVPPLGGQHRDQASNVGGSRCA